MYTFISKKIKLPNELAFSKFVQAMSDRVTQGHCRYGPPCQSKMYFDRLKLEVKAYEKTGNVEHLYNIANYCHLEEYAPQHPKNHKNTGVGSVTRGRV